MEKPMMTKSGKYFAVAHFHFVLHNAPLYYENPKESSGNIKKMKMDAKIAALFFHFKKIFFILKNDVLPKEVLHGQH